MLKRGSVILAEVFFSDSGSGKIRPAIVLSDNEYNRTGYVALAPITTAGDDYCLQMKEADADCTLDRNSGVRFDCIIRMHQKQVLKRIGKVTQQFYGMLVEKIMGTIKQDTTI